MVDRPRRVAVRRAIKNPFEFGRELTAAELVDRADELRQIIRASENGGKLFLIGPRRFGKTSLLAVAETELKERGIIMLRYDAERYESLDLLAAALLTGASRRLARTAERARTWLSRLAGALKPEVTYSATELEFTISLGVRSERRTADAPLLADVLDVIEKMAREAKTGTTVVIDEFQAAVRLGGEDSERTLRAAVQRHRHVGYVFAGSATRLMADMTGDPGRAFYKLGARLFIRTIPRPDFLAFLGTAFAASAFGTSKAALERILDLSEDVPYNVQRLAHECWETLRVAAGSPHRRDLLLTPDRVDRALSQVLLRENSWYTQLWNDHTQQQKRAIKAVVLEGGRGLTSSAVSERYQVPTATMQKALKALDAKGIVREEEELNATRYRLEDPFFGAWLRMVQEL